MVSSRFVTVVAFASAAVAQDYLTWEPAGPDDVRGPCPMLNTLANHGFITHSGKDMDQDVIVTGISSALNIDPDALGFLFEKAVTTSPAAPNATTFSLNDLTTHNILEHDGSLSRKDFFFGDPGLFDQATFDETHSFWTAETVDIQMAANARINRILTSVNSNPDFTLSDLGSDFDAGETAAYMIVFGDRVAGTAPRNFLETFFQNERLPTDLGWVKPAEIITDVTLEDTMTRIREATFGNLTAPNPAANLKKRSVRRIPFH